MDPTGKLQPSNFIQNAYQIGLPQHLALPEKTDDNREIAKKGADAAGQTGELGRKGAETDKQLTTGKEEAFVRGGADEDKQFQQMDALKNMAQGIREEKPSVGGAQQKPVQLMLPFAEFSTKGPETTNETAPKADTPPKTEVPPKTDVPPKAEVPPKANVPPFVSAQSQGYREYEEISQQNKHLLKEVFAGRLPLQFVPDLPLGVAGNRLQTLRDFTMKDQSGNKEMSFWKKWTMKGPQKTMQQYDNFANVMTDRQMAQNPKLDREKLYLYNLSHVILNDKDRMTGKPKMQNMAASAYQYVRAYDGAAAQQAQRKSPAKSEKVDLESLLSKLSPKEQEAFIEKEKALNDTAMLMAARGKPLSPEDIQALRASNLVELGRTGKIDPKIADQAKNFLMSTQDMGSGGDLAGDFNINGLPGQNPQPGNNQPPGNYPPGTYPPGNYPVPPGTNPPGNYPMPPGTYPPGVGAPGQDMSGFMNMLVAQEQASKMQSMMMMMMVGGPFMLPYALMMMLMPSSTSYMSSAMRMNQQMPTPQFPGQTPYPGQTPGQVTDPRYGAQNPYGQAGQMYRQPPLLERDGSSWLDTDKKKPTSWLDEANKAPEKVEEGEESAES